jgi:hypothetical protein
MISTTVRICLDAALARPSGCDLQVPSFADIAAVFGRDVLVQRLHEILHLEGDPAYHFGTLRVRVEADPDLRRSLEAKLRIAKNPWLDHEQR